MHRIGRISRCLKNINPTIYEERETLMESTAEKTILKMGNSDMEWGKDILPLRDCNDIFDDTTALRERMAEDGYLYIRGLHDKEKVLSARRQVLEKLAANGALDPTVPLMDGVIKAGAKGKFLGGKNSLTAFPSYLELVESKRVMGFFDRFLGGPATTFDYKWLRAVGNGDCTGAHYDIVYMGRGTENLYTCWTPLGDCPFELGALAVCVGSHKAAFAKLRQTYGKLDIDRDRVGSGWYSSDPLEVVQKFGGQWRTAEFQAGDAMIFGMYTLHMSLTHTAARYRLSSDTRYQLASEPQDERWIGENPKAHGESANTKLKTMEQARQEWGV